MTIQETPFHHLQAQAGAKFVDFHGWSLPVQFSTITREHEAVRERAGLFDISHMGQVFVWGPEAEAYLQNLLTNDMKKAPVGKGIYAHMLNEKGGVIDDVYAFHVEDERWLVIVNASRKTTDLDWMVRQSEGFQATVMEAPQAAGLALQGPRAVEIVDRLSSGAAQLPKNAIGEFQVADVAAFVSRTGYTGEDGFEFFAPAGHLIIIWSALTNMGRAVGLDLCGLGARDTLRTEVAYPLYGQELSEDRTPLEAGLGWVVKFDKETFIGRDALLKRKEAGFKQKLAGFEVTGGGVARHGALVSHDGKIVGEVTSGTFSPTLKKPVGLAYLPPEISPQGAPLLIKMGARELPARTVPLPFYKPGKTAPAGA